MGVKRKKGGGEGGIYSNNLILLCAVNKPEISTYFSTEYFRTPLPPPGCTREAKANFSLSNVVSHLFSLL